MLFLLNDTVVNIEAEDIAAAGQLARKGPLRMDFVTRMGQELYSEDPLVHRNNKERATRLASLILMKAPEANAALFLAPSKGCGPDQVSYRFAQVDFEVICGLWTRQKTSGPSTLDADRNVWRRLAA